MKKSFKNNAAMQFISAAEEPQKEEKEEKLTPQGAGSDEPADVPNGYKLVKASKSIRMQLLVRPRTKEALVKMAEGNNLSVNEVVNRILETYIEEHMEGYRKL